MRVIQPHDGGSLPRYRRRPSQSHSRWHCPETAVAPSSMARPSRRYTERFDGAHMTDEHRPRPHAARRGPAHRRPRAWTAARDSPPGGAQGRIRLPLVVARDVVSAARQNLGAAQAFPRPMAASTSRGSRMMDSPWTSASGSAVATAGEADSCRPPRGRAVRRHGQVAAPATGHAPLKGHPDCR